MTPRYRWTARDYCAHGAVWLAFVLLLMFVGGRLLLAQTATKADVDAAATAIVELMGDVQASTNKKLDTLEAQARQILEQLLAASPTPAKPDRNWFVEFLTSDTFKVLLGILAGLVAALPKGEG